MDWTDFKKYVTGNNDAYILTDDAYIEQCWDEAEELVTHFVGTQTVPQSIMDRAALICGAALYQTRKTPMGIAQFGEDNSPIRLARDPMQGAYPLLKAYMVVGI
ncbi:hypothetical protein [Streptomyces prunicolor]|uniref:hypothetical protein n=1 Tax=Streptomyces prunicolor TaxID=67348 RepID=UPI000376A441|nr:hypothetical protein [Streptomyces prunicolor]